MVWAGVLLKSLVQIRFVSNEEPFILLPSDKRSFALARSASRAPESILTGCPELGEHF